MTISEESRPKKVRSPGKRRRLNPDARRIELLQAALRVLGSRGPVNARVEDVTDEAGAAKGTFYRYFASWEDLLVAVRGYLLSTYVAEMHAKFEAAARSDWWAAFESECVRFVDFVVGLGALHKAIFHGPIADRPIEDELSSGTVIAVMLGKGIQAGACRSVDVDIAAPLLFSVLHATADGIAQSGDRERRIDSMLEMLRAWLRISGKGVVIHDNKRIT